MIDDSIDGIDFQGSNLDSFRNQLIIKGMYDHYYEKVTLILLLFFTKLFICMFEKYLLKQYQVVDYLSEMLQPKYVNHSYSFLTLMINFHKERFNNQVQYEKDAQFITIFTYSLKHFSYQILEFEYLYKLISSSDRLGLKPLMRYFKIRKLIFSYIYDHRNTILFLDQYNLQFEEWSGIICRIFGPEQITAIGNQIRALNQRFNQMDKIWKNSISSLDFIKICMKYSRQQGRNHTPSLSPNKNSMVPSKSEGQFINTFFQNNEFNNPKTVVNAQNEKKGSFAFKQKQNVYTQNTNSTINRKDQMSVSSYSRSPQKPTTSTKNQHSSPMQLQINKNIQVSPLSNKAEIMNQAPKIFQTFFLENQQKNEQKSVTPIEQQKQQQPSHQNGQYNLVNKDGIVVNCELAHKYEELATFTKELQTTINKYILTMKKGITMNEEDLMLLAKKNTFENFVENPYSMMLQSIGSSIGNQKDHANRNNENMRQRDAH